MSRYRCGDPGCDDEYEMLQGRFTTTRQENKVMFQALQAFWDLYQLYAFDPEDQLTSGAKKLKHGLRAVADEVPELKEAYDEVMRLKQTEGGSE